MEETLRNLMRMIPGYKGYESREDRREADRVLRTNLAQQFRSEQQTITQLSKKALDRGGLQHMNALEEVNRGLYRYISRLESAPLGYTGLMSKTKIDEAELNQIYEFDAKLADSVPLLREQIAYAEKQLGTDSFGEAVAALQTFVESLNVQFDERLQFVAAGKE